MFPLLPSSFHPSTLSPQTAKLYTHGGIRDYVSYRTLCLLFLLDLFSFPPLPHPTHFPSPTLHLNLSSSLFFMFPVTTALQVSLCSTPWPLDWGISMGHPCPTHPDTFFTDPERNLRKALCIFTTQMKEGKRGARRASASLLLCLLFIYCALDHSETTRWPHTRLVCSVCHRAERPLDLH